MKKHLVAAALSACLALSVNAQESASGASADKDAKGAVDYKLATAVGVTVGFALALSSNSAGVAPDPEIVCDEGETLVGGICVPDVDPEAECDEGDSLVDGVCIGTDTTNTVTVSGTGTNAVTITSQIPVTFTYLPTIRS